MNNYYLGDSISSTSTSGTMTIDCYSTLNLSAIHICVNSTLNVDSTSTSSFALKVTDGTQTITSPTVTVPNGTKESYIRVPLDFTTIPNSTLTFSFSTRSNTTFYRARKTDDDFFTDVQLYLKDSYYVYRCFLEIDQIQKVWCNTNNNEENKLLNYPQLTNNLDTGDFTWNKDPNTNLPYNSGVWKISEDKSINQGYPYIIFNNVTPTSHLDVYYTIVQSNKLKLVPLGVYLNYCSLNSDNQLVPVLPYTFIE